MQQLHFSRTTRISIILPFLVLILCCSCQYRKESFRSRAEKLTAEKQYAQAIEAYQRHIEHRLSLADRPEWDNPYIYLLDIGDLYLEQGQVNRAIETYELAEEKEVRSEFVNDRYRHIAAWYEKQQQREKALEILNQYRSRDPLLFDLMMDRIAKDIVAYEEQQLKESNTEGNLHNTLEPGSALLQIKQRTADQAPTLIAPPPLLVSLPALL
jgi:tetratricopeptide (TPR) repeat protein